ncbi:MAG: hypothetical protein ACE5HE_08860 [Phycisphaerae bacterium]
MVEKLDAIDEKVDRSIAEQAMRYRRIDDKLDATREDIAELKGASQVSGGLWGGVVAAAIVLSRELARFMASQ